MKDMNELNNKIAEKLEEILGQNYVDEYSGSDRHIGTDEIAAQLLPTITDQVRLGKKEERRKLTYAKVDKSVLESDGLKVHFDFKFHDKCSEEHFAVFGVSDDKWSVAIDGQNIVSRLKATTKEGK